MKLLRVSQVARILDMAESRIYELCRLHILSHTRFGRQIRISEEQLKDYILNGGKALQGGWKRKV